MSLRHRLRGGAAILAFTAGQACGFAAVAQPAPSAPPPPPTVAACGALQPSFGYSDAAARLARIPDAPTSIVSARVEPAQRGLPAVCRVEGQIAPTIGFLMRLPLEGWNGKLMMGGCGGPCGTYLSDRLDPALARRYATVSTDMGHKGIGWIAYYQNLQAQLDFGSRSTHLTAVVGKAIVDAFYGRAPAYTYFNGCSTGGRQAMVEAQRFPDDFNGIVGGAPPYDEIGDTPYFLSWGARANIDAAGRPILDAAKLPMIHQAVMDACVDASSRAAGVLLNPGACRWEPTAIVCKPGADAKACLTPAEAGVVAKIYTGAVNSKGRRLYFGMARGSELTWTPAFVNSGGKPGDYLAGFGGPGNSLMTYGAFFYSPGPTYSEKDFDYDKDPARIAVNEALYDARNPDLRAFKEAGGKLILYHGWNDNQIPPGASIDYYETATRTLGGPAATRLFFRMFLLPGVGHCRGGPGGGEVDWISAIEAWVEHGQAPDQVTAYRMKVEPYPTIQLPSGETALAFPHHPLDASTYEAARPVFAYPAVAALNGHGDPATAQAWKPAVK